MATKTIRTCDLCSREMTAEDSGLKHFVQDPVYGRFLILIGMPAGTGIQDVCLTCRVTISKNDPVVDVLVETVA